MVFCLTQAKKAQQALALCLAQIRTQDPETERATTTDPKAAIQVHHLTLTMPALHASPVVSNPKDQYLSSSSSGMPAKARVCP